MKREDLIIMICEVVILVTCAVMICTAIYDILR